MSAEAVNRFTLDVLNQLYLSQNSTGNIAFSGTVLYLTLGAISIGLRGRSHEKLSKFLQRDVDRSIDNEDWVKSESAKRWSKLRSKSTIEKSYKISAIYPGGLSAHYERISRKIFKGVDTKIDFSNAEMSANEINLWINSRVISDGIFNVVKKPMVSENKILFISTVYFQLPWKGEFYIYPEKQMFIGDNDEVSKADMICQLNIVGLYIPPSNNFKIIFISAFNDDISLAIVVQQYGYSTHKMLKSFKVEQLPTYFEQSESQLVKLVLPKFNLPASYDFVPELIKLGLTDIFYRNETDFGRITNRSVMMENLIQITSVSVDEFGINTYRTHGDTSAESDVDEHRVDRTFLLLIYSKSDYLVHFSALVNNPTAE